MLRQFLSREMSQKAELSSAGQDAGSRFDRKIPSGPVRVRVCWRPRRKRWSVKDPPASGNKSSVRVTGREPEARGANDTPDHPPQTRECPVLVTSSEDQAICNQTPTPCRPAFPDKPRRVSS